MRSTKAKGKGSTRVRVGPDRLWGERLGKVQKGGAVACAGVLSACDHFRLYSPQEVPELDRPCGDTTGSDRETGRETDRQTGRQADRQTDIQTYRQTDKDR